MDHSVISLEHIHFSYGNKKVLSNIHLDISKGSFIGLTGPNGGGKTTLIKIMLGMLSPDEGIVKILGQPIKSFNHWNKIGYVSQTANRFNRGFPATVFEVVAMGLTRKIGYLRFFRKKHKQKVKNALERVNMASFANEKIGNLSGGQQQRVFIARALVGDPELIILDEPTVGIDDKNVEQFYNLLSRLNEQENITLLLVTHDTERMQKYVTDIICINQTINFHGPVKEYALLSNKNN